MLRFSAAIAFAFAAFMVTASAGHAQETVSATVSVQAVSITVTPNSINYGTIPFAASRSSLAAPGGSVTFTATNNGNVSESFLVRGSDASGDGLSWTLITGAVSCGPAANNDKFRHSVTKSGSSAIYLATSDDTLATGISAGSSINFTSEIYTPCPGSSGTGATANTTIVVTAVASP